MRVKIRECLDTDQPINLKTLKPVDKLVAGFSSKWKETRWYQRNKYNKAEELILEQNKKDEKVKNYLLAYLYKELNNNTTLEQKSKKCVKVVLVVKSEFEDSLKRLLPSVFNLAGTDNKDFLPFTIKRVKEEEDLRRAFKNMPILLEATKKYL